MRGRSGGGLVRQQERSGLPVQRFCRQCGLAASSPFACAAEFANAEASQPDMAKEAAALIGRLYGVEEETRDVSTSEREMKRIVLNCKNSLFVGDRRGWTAAILASLTSTCRRHAIDRQRYLTQLLSNLPATRLSDLDHWLPNAWNLRAIPPPIKECG